jgi:peptidyl-prolyl cis-trans isomerase D
MAILTKIRNRSGLAIGVVGGALLLFVISDALNSNSSLFSGQASSNNVAEIDGETIGIRQFEERLEINTENFKKRSQQENLDENTLNQVREQTWTQVMNDYLMLKQYKDLGIEISNEELEDMLIGKNIHPQILQSFTDPATGQFDVNNVKRYLKQMSEGTDENMKAQWKEFEDYLVTDGQQRKFTNLLKKGVYTTSLEAKSAFQARTATAEFNFVAIPYMSIVDTTITAEESDLKSYFKKNMDKYKERENSRKLEFVVWDFAPSSEDSAAAQKWAYDQLEQFKSTDNDTTYTNSNSELGFDPTAKNRSAYPEELQAQLFSSAPGTVFGPMFKNGKYSIYKVVGEKEDTAFSMRASHILIRVEGATMEDTIKARTKANDILTRIKKGESFAALASEFGTDGTKDKGGDLGWFTEGAMVKDFNDAIKNGRKGDQFVLKTQFGFHVIKITEDKSKKLVTAAVLERTVAASDKTTGVAYNEASTFAAASTDAKSFEANIAEKKMEKRVAEFVKENDNFLPGFNEAREVVKWAYTAKVGAVSEVITIGNDKYVIATVNAIREKGKASFEASRERVLADYRKDKKAEQLMEKMKTAMESNTTLDALSRNLNQALNPVPSQTFENSSVPMVGYDPSFVGTVMGTPAGKLVGPVKGDGGVYAFQVTKSTPAPAQSDLNNFKTEISSAIQSRIEYSYLEVLKEVKNVKDYRYKFY